MFQSQSSDQNLDSQEQSKYQTWIRLYQREIDTFLFDFSEKVPSSTNIVNPDSNQNSQFQLQQPPRLDNIQVQHHLPQLPPAPVVEIQINNRPRRRVNTPKREDYQKNITKVTLHKMAREFHLIPDVRDAISSMLEDAGIHMSQFEDLLKEIAKRNSISNAILLRNYLAPNLNDTKYEVKKIFSQYYMYYLNNYFTIATEESNQVQKLKTYIQYSRRYLAYLAKMEDGIVQPSSNILNITRI